MENDTNALSDANKAKLENPSSAGPVTLNSDFRIFNLKLKSLSDLSPVDQSLLLCGPAGGATWLDIGGVGQALKNIAGTLAWADEPGGGDTAVTVTQQSILTETAVAQGTLAGSVAGATQIGII